MQQLYRMLAAALGWFALGLQYVLIVRYKTDGDPLLERIFLNLVGLIVVFAGLGLLLVGLDNGLGRLMVKHREAS